MLARALRRTFGFVVGVMLTGSSAFAQVPAAPVNDYVYTLPPAWTATPYPDGLVLMSPPSATNERCVFTVWPMRPAGTNLLQDAYAVFQDVFRTYEPRPLTTRVLRCRRRSHEEHPARAGTTSSCGEASDLEARRNPAWASFSLSN